MDDHNADELLRRALIEPEASAAVALRVAGLPLCESLTVVFHGRRDLGTIQTYVARGRHGAGDAPSPPSDLMRVPCDLDLGDAEDREEAERAVRRAGHARCATRSSAPTPCSTSGASRSRTSPTPACRSTAASTSASTRPPTGCCRPRCGAGDSRSSSPPCAAPARWPRAARRWASPACSRTSPACTRCPTTPSAASRTSSTSPPTTPAGWRTRSSARSASRPALPRAQRLRRRLTAALAVVRRCPGAPAITAIVFGAFVFLSISLLLTKALVGSGNERARGARRPARPGGAATPRACSRRLPACARDRTCARLVADRAERLARPGQVEILNYTPSVQVALTDRRGVARVAWRTPSARFPVVQCVVVERQGPLTGGGVELVSVSNPIGSEASCD